MQLLNSQPLEAFRLFESTASGIALVNEDDAATRRANYALDLMAYGDRYGVVGYTYGTRIIDPMLSETTKALPAKITARLYLHRGKVQAKLYAAIGHVGGQEAFVAAQKDLNSAQNIAEDEASGSHSAASAYATEGWLNLKAAQFTYDDEADPFLEQANKLLTIARDRYEQLDASFELALVKLDLADLLDRLSVRDKETVRMEKFDEAITLLKESEVHLKEGHHPVELARTYQMAAKLFWNEAVYRLGSGGVGLLDSAQYFAEMALDLRPVDADPLGWAETSLLIAEIRADQVAHNMEDNRIAGFEEATKTIQNAVRIYEEMGTEEQIAEARHRGNRLSWQIEEEKGAV